MAHEPNLFQRLRQSDAASQGELQSDAVAGCRDDGELTTSRLTYDTARAIGVYLVVRCGITDEDTQHAVIQMFAAVLLDALHLSRDEAERAVLEVIKWIHRANKH